MARRLIIFFGHFRLEFQNQIVSVQRQSCLGPESEIRAIIYAIEKITKIRKKAWFHAFWWFLLGHFRFEFQNSYFTFWRYSPVESGKKISGKLNLAKKLKKFVKTVLLEKRVFGLGTGSTPKYIFISAKMGQVSPYQVPIKPKKFGVNRCSYSWDLG